MAQGINTVRPGTPANGGTTVLESLNGWTVTGAANAVAALSDNSDASYITSPAGNYTGAGGGPLYCRIPIAAPPILPANQSVQYGQLRLRVSDLGGGSNQALPLQVQFVGSSYFPSFDAWSPKTIGGMEQIADTGLGAPTTLSLTQRTSNPMTGGQWIVATIQAGTTYKYQTMGTLDAICLGTIWYATKQYRVYEAYFDLFFNDDPSAPTFYNTTNITSPRPTSRWTYNDTEQNPYIIHESWWYTAAQYGAGGFVAGQPPYAAHRTVVPNGLVGANASPYTTTPDTLLQNGITYRCYSRVTQALWAKVSPISAGGTAFTVSVALPAVPSITATADSANGRVAINCQGRENVLTYDESSMESFSLANSSWTATNCTKTASTVSPTHGTNVMNIQANAAGNMSIALPGQLKTVIPGQTYTAIATFRRQTGGQPDRNCHVDITWCYAGGAVQSTSTGPGTSVGIVNTKVTNTAVAPANTYSAIITCQVDGCTTTAENYSVDAVSFVSGTSTTWTPGGMTTSYRYDGGMSPSPNNGTGQTIYVERSADNGTTWVPVRCTPVTSDLDGIPDSAIAFQTQVATTVYDLEAPLGTPVIYRATSVISYGANDTGNPALGSPMILTSAPSASTSPVSITAPPGGQGFWLKNTATGTTMAIEVIDDTFDLELELQTATFAALGREDPVVVSDVAMLAKSGSTSFEFLNDASWFNFRDNFFQSLNVCLLQKYDGQQWYIAFEGTGNLSEFKGSLPIYRTFKTKWSEVQRPGVD